MKKLFRAVLKIKTKKNERKKGAALIAALFTVAIVLILGVSFIVLSINQSRNTLTSKESILAYQVANSGAEMVLNYMSFPSNWIADTGSSVDPSLNMNSKLKNKTECGGSNIDFRGCYITKLDRVHKTEPSSGKYYYEYTIEATGKSGTTPSKFVISSGYAADWQVTLEQKVVTAGQPPNYILTSTGRVYTAGSSTPKAMRQVVLRFREKSALDGLIFFQNQMAYDRVATAAPPPNATDFSEGMVGINKDSNFKGDVCIDGGSQFASSTAGKIQFFDTNNVNFFGKVSIRQGANNYITPPPGGGEDKGMFHGKFLTGQTPRGLPSKEGYMNEDLNGNGRVDVVDKGWAAQLANDNSPTPDHTASYARAFYRCGDNDGLSTSSGVIGHSAGQSAAWNGNDPNMNRNIPSDIEFDGGGSSPANRNAAPGFCKFLVEFSEDTSTGEGRVTIKKKTAYTNRTYTLANNIKVSDFKNGMLYFEGGNVEVKGKCTGQLTVVSAECPYREPYSFNVTTKAGATINQVVGSTGFGNIDQNIDEIKANYHTYNSGDSTWDGFGSSTKHSYAGSNSNNLYVDFDSLNATLQGYAEGKEKCLPFKNSDGRWVFPVNGDEMQKTVMNVGTKGVYRPLDREGSITISGNVEYGGSNSALGLIAKNWILLNKEGATLSGDILKLRAAVTSFDHSMQFDDVDYSNKNSSIANLKNGKFDFLGSIISQFSDVEGKADGMGYQDHSLVWDRNFKYVLPPHFPKWNIHDFSSGVVVEYVILGYEDKGAVALTATPSP